MTPSATQRIGAEFRRIRKKSGLRQAEAAERCGVGTRFISDLENGKPTLRLDKVLKALGAFGLTLEVGGVRRDWPVRVMERGDPDDDLRYWLGRSPQERVEAVEFLRSQYFALAGREEPPRLTRELSVSGRRR